MEAIRDIRVWRFGCITLVFGSFRAAALASPILCERHNLNFPQAMAFTCSLWPHPAWFEPWEVGLLIGMGAGRKLDRVLDLPGMPVFLSYPRTTMTIHGVHQGCTTANRSERLAVYRFDFCDRYCSRIRPCQCLQNDP